MENERAKETTAIVTGLGLAGLGLFCGLSLLSHQPADVMDFAGPAPEAVANLGGRLGAMLAQHLLALYGVGAWVLTVGLLAFGAMLCAARSLSGMLLRGGGALLLLLVVCAWAGTLALPREMWRAPDALFSNPYPAGLGGLLGGTYLAQPLVDYFGSVGVYLVLVTAGLLSGLMLAQDLTESFLAGIGRGCLRLACWVWSAFQRFLKATERPLAGKPLPAAAVSSPSAARATDETDGETQTLSRNERALLEEAPGATTRRLRPARLASGKRGDEASAASPARNAVTVNPEEEQARQRREEAVRQAEQAEQARLQQEKEMREQLSREAKALAKLEKERAAQNRERGKARAKFFKSMNKENGGDGKEAEASGTSAREKAQLPADYKLPEFGLLEAKDHSSEVSSEALKERGAKLIETLWEFKIGSRLVGIQHGPTVTMFELSLDPGIKVSRIISLSDNLAMAMKSEYGVRIIAPIPGKDTIGIEIPNHEDYVVRMRPILESTAFRSGNWTLPLVLGRDATGNPLIADLSHMPHLLIAGTTGSGKSVCVNSIILSLMVLRRPHEVKLILVDPKRVEMNDYKGIPHLLSPVVTDMKLAAGVLTWAVQKMEERYERLSKVGVRNIATFNRMSREERLARLPEDTPPDEFVDPMPYIVIIVDEFADLMMNAGKEIEQAIARLAQKARAAGIHVILATQRPSADVVTGLIKSNLPCRICFQVQSKVESRIVLDASGGDKLAGKGDMLFLPPGTSQLIRAKGVFVADHEITQVVGFCKKQAEPLYNDEIEKAARGGMASEGSEGPPLDDRFEEAVECLLGLGRASVSLLQRRLGVGYTRAAKLCDQMEARGIVGPDRGPKGRELLITKESWTAYKSGQVEDATWGPLGSKDNPGPSSPSEAGPIACLDDVDGTRADENGVDPEAGDGAARPDPALVGQLDAGADD